MTVTDHILFCPPTSFNHVWFFPKENSRVYCSRFTGWQEGQGFANAICISLGYQQENWNELCRKVVWDLKFCFFPRSGWLPRGNPSLFRIIFQFLSVWKTLNWLEKWRVRNEEDLNYKDPASWFGPSAWLKRWMFYYLAGFPSYVTLHSLHFLVLSYTNSTRPHIPFSHSRTRGRLYRSWGSSLPVSRNEWKSLGSIKSSLCEFISSYWFLG